MHQGLSYFILLNYGFIYIIMIRTDILLACSNRVNATHFGRYITHAIEIRLDTIACVT